MKEKLVTRSDFKGLHPLLEGKLGDKIIDLGMKLAGLHHANAVYDRSKHLTGRLLQGCARQAGCYPCAA